MMPDACASLPNLIFANLDWTNLKSVIIGSYRYVSCDRGAVHVDDVSCRCPGTFRRGD